MQVFFEPPQYKEFDVKNIDLNKILSQVVPPYEMEYKDSIA